MRTIDEIRETAFIVARQYLAVEGARERPMGPVYQLHLDVLDLQIHAEADAERLAEKDAEIERLTTSRRSAWQEADRLRGDKGRLVTEESRLQARLNLRDAEIERLKADLAQSRSAITKLSREIWKVC